MEKSNKEKQKIKHLVKLLIYIGIISVSFIFSIIALRYEWTIAFQILFGIFSGSLISMLSFLSAKTQPIESDENDVLSLIAQMKAKDKGDDVKIYGSLDDLGFAEMLTAAKERIWVLGVDLSDFVMRYKECLLGEEGVERDIRILGMHPNNVYVESRYNEEKFHSKEEMSNSLVSATNDMKELLQSDPDRRMQIKLYLSQPTVMLYAVDDKLIISHIMNSKQKKKVVNTVLMLCDTANFESLADDFIGEDGHFNKIWAEALDIDDCDFGYYEPQGLDIDDKIMRFNISKDNKRFAADCKRFFKSAAKHIRNLLFPVISASIAIIVLGLILGGVINNEMMQEVFFNYIVATILGFISSALLTFIVYIYDTVNENRERDEKQNETDDREKQIVNDLNGLNLSGRYNIPSGIKVYKARKDIDIKSLIVHSQKRVWIYATNHRVIGDRQNNVEVVDYLNGKAGDIDVRFLMLDPESIFTATRFHEIPSKKTRAEFANELSGRLGGLNDEYGKNKKVKMRLFVMPPTFMMYLFDDLLVVSYILRQGRASDQAAFTLDLNNPKVRIFANKFIDHFNAVWESGEKFGGKTIRYFSDQIKKHKPQRYKIQTENGISYAKIKQIDQPPV